MEHSVDCRMRYHFMCYARRILRLSGVRLHPSISRWKNHPPWDCSLMAGGSVLHEPQPAHFDRRSFKTSFQPGTSRPFAWVAPAWRRCLALGLDSLPSPSRTWRSIHATSAAHSLLKYPSTSSCLFVLRARPANTGTVEAHMMLTSRSACVCGHNSFRPDDEAAAERANV